MKNISKIVALGISVTGITGSIFAIMKRRKIVHESLFDDEIGEDEATEMVENNEESSSEDELPEFTKYTGIPVNNVTDMLNAVTHRYNFYGQDDDFYYIKSEDFEMIRQLLGVSRMYIRDNYLPNLFDKVGEMVTFRIREDYCVSNDGWFLISGVWTYLSKDEVFDDYIRCAKCKERLFETDMCRVI